MCIEPSVPLEGVPWGSVLTFFDPGFEHRFWCKRVSNLLLPCDRITYALGIVFAIVTYFKLQLPNSGAMPLSLVPVFLCSGCLAWMFYDTHSYTRWRTWCVVVMRSLLVPIISAAWAFILPPKPSTSAVVARLLFSPNFYVHMSLNIGFQLKFRTHIAIQLASVVMSTHFTPVHCSAWFEGDSFTPIIKGVAGDIDWVVRALWTLRLEPLSADRMALDGDSACWLVGCFFQWIVCGLSSTLLYCLETHSRVGYLLSVWEPDAKGRQNLWAFWRDGVVSCCWTFVIVSLMAYAVLKSST